MSEYRTNWSMCDCSKQKDTGCTNWDGKGDEIAMSRRRTKLLQCTEDPKTCGFANKRKPITFGGKQL